MMSRRPEVLVAALKRAEILCRLETAPGARQFAEALLEWYGRPMAPASGSPASIAFGRFRVLPQRRELLADGRPVKLGERAFELLLALIEARGTVLGKDALMRRAWPDRIVEENNLQAQISALRAAFGAERGLIRTVAGRGYQFTGEIEDLPGGRDGAAPTPAAPAPATNLPEPVSELIGRDDELQEVLKLAAACRLVTLTGPGGIGKTRLALAAARRLLPHVADGAWLAEFSPLADPALVPAAVAAAVGLALGNGEVSPQRVAQALGDRRLLLVFDTCEHVIAAAAAMAEALLQAGSGVRLIATSREPLRAEGEQLYPVPPLAAPAAMAADPWRYGAVRLFAVRSRASGAQVPDHPGVATAIAAICRRLEGMPLAIELAAARTASLGLDEVALRLDDRFRLLTGGRRTALPRHQTLRATLDWSYELLAEPERVVLRRLAVFAGPFGLEAAAAVAGGADLAPADVVEALSNLVAKSLAATEPDAALARYRLLDTTRAYALEKLGGSGERPAAAGRHAAFYRDLFERAEAEWQTRPMAEWLGAYGRQIDNLRAALDWAFGPGGDAAAGVALTAAAVPLWLHLSLLEECRGRIERALAALAAGTPRDPRREMKLHAALGAALLFTQGAVPALGAAWTKALELAEQLGDAEYRLRSLWGLWSFHLSSCRNRRALRLALRFRALAARRPEPEDRLTGERMIGLSLFYLGDQGISSARSPLSARRRASRPSSAFRSTSGRRRAPSWRGCCGSRDFRIRPCAPPKRASPRPRQASTPSPSATCSRMRHGWHSWSAMSTGRNTMRAGCSIMRRGMRPRCGAPSAVAIRA
jgi:predicted ATPase/DNA-binding winged helix-turn-helix (wHTH) protein